jgi:hypothetical protein
VDSDEDAVRISKQLFPTAQIARRDFFQVEAQEIGLFDAVVGNPPFIRYQTFAGQARLRALRQAEKAGVKIPQLASSWAPFLVHAIGLVKPGGRLAMVVPAELGHAKYARHVLNFVAQQFAKVQVYMFRKKLFPDLSEDTFLLFAEERGGVCQWFGVSAFSDIEEARLGPCIETPVDIGAITAGHTRLSHYLLSTRARGLYQRLAHENGIMRLGEVADVGIGYVTGCNEYFHVTAADAWDWGLGRTYLKPCVTSLGSYRGLSYRGSDWQAMRDSGEKAFLLSLPPFPLQRFSRGVRKYIQRGEAMDVPGRYKCRVRDPWYSVPHVRSCDAFLSYMSGGLPRLVLNPKKLVAPNTLHLVQFAYGIRGTSVVAGWHSSLTRLSCEMEGHPLGGGMLKLEPTEASRLLVALPKQSDSRRVIQRVDAELRSHGSGSATEIVDSAVLRKRFGLTASECAILRDSAARLESWRMHR